MNITAAHAEVDSPQSWVRLWISLALMTIGGCGMYVVIVVLPGIQAEFGVTRAQASLPYTHILSSNKTATTLGVQPGIKRATALALAPDLKLFTQGHEQA